MNGLWGCQLLVSVALDDTVQQVEVPESELFTFPRGVVGFEEYDRYALFELNGPLYLLQSVDDPGVGFVLMDPFALQSDYEPGPSEEDRALLGLKGGVAPQFLCIVTLSADGIPTSVNLRAPIVFNSGRKVAAQVILADTRYPVRFPVSVDESGDVLQASGAQEGSEAEPGHGGGPKRGRRC